MTARRPEPATGPAPGSTAALRTANQQRVLEVLRAAPSGSTDEVLTQAELARVTGLAPATVSNIVRELSSHGLVETEPGSGRRGTSVRLARDAGLVGGVDFGHSHLAVALGDLGGRIVAEDRRRLDESLGYAAGLDLAEEMLAELTPEGGRVLRVGLGLPAPIHDDYVGASSVSPGWEGVNTRVAAEERFDVPVVVDNDANLGALAEHRQGVAHGHDSAVFVKISSGVGAGIIIANRLFRGAGGSAGEIGHLTLDEQGPICRCGSRGCLEAYTSIHTVTAMVAAQLPDATFDDVVESARSGSVAAQRAFEDAGLHLGWGVASIVNLLNPAIVVIGGDMARAGDLVLESTRVGMRRHALDGATQTPVVASELGERASLVGAVQLAAERTELSV
ncbi:MAG TPA: ROK family transcriptional regulator [Nocardioides sp.]|nr:ROK family transcriptional regulator [Nocardioides sp.]